MHNRLFVFDIETIPDCLAGKSLCGIDSDDVAEIRKAMVDYHLEITKQQNDFLRQPFHQVVSISFVDADIIRDHDGERYEIRNICSGGEGSADERELVSGFYKFIANKPRIVTFGGRNFDISVLQYRAMKYGISGASYHLSGTKWDSYSSRYSVEWHCDLLEVFSDYGASAKIKLKEICATLGIPSKYDVDGTMVMDLYDKGEIKAINQYCEIDSINTYLLYLRHGLHRGTISLEGYKKSLENFIQYIESQNKEHLSKFLQLLREDRFLTDI